MLNRVALPELDDERLVSAVLSISVGLLVAIGTLLGSGWTTSSVAGVIAGAAIISLGFMVGIPRMRREIAASVTHAARRSTWTLAFPGLLASASIVTILALILGLAALMDELSTRADLGLDLGVVCRLTASAALLYGGTLQYLAAAGQRIAHNPEIGEAAGCGDRGATAGSS